MENYLDFEKSRYSCRQFSDEKLTEEELSTILEAARLAPTAKNQQSVRICVAQGIEALEKINECTQCHYGAPVVLIVAYDEDIAAKLADGIGPDTCTFGDIDATIAITYMENAVASLGLGSCWIGAFNSDAVREKFNVPENYKLVELFMIGYKAADPSPRHEDRQPLENMVTHDSF